MKCETYHIPVLLKETVDGLDIQPGGVYLDLTMGGGGHSREILSRLTGGARLFSFDQDLDAIPYSNGEHADLFKEARDNGSFTFVRSNFRYIRNWMMYYGIETVDGILADLGVSSHHLDQEDRGFSFRFDAPLDMRMNQRARLTARQVVNEYPEEQLADVLFLYGELRNSRRIASAIIKARNQRCIATTTQLAEVLQPLMGHDREKKDLARVFQALRIEVNGEMTALKEMLTAAARILRPGGRLSILTYHSLEDRMVKNLIKAGNPEGKVESDIFGRVATPLKAVNRNVIIPSAEEQSSNPRSRSAKLRIAEKTNR